jgi:hypothetical protein
MEVLIYSNLLNPPTFDDMPSPPGFTDPLLRWGVKYTNVLTEYPISSGECGLAECNLC